MLRALALVGLACASDAEQPTYEVLNGQSHDPTVFVQCLEQVADRIFETGGLYGKSTLGDYEIRDRVWNLLRRRHEKILKASEFAEGCAWVPSDHDKYMDERLGRTKGSLAPADGLLYLLTWREKVVHVFDPVTWEIVQTHPVNTDGWGLCYDVETRLLIMTDGSDTLFFRDPKDMSLVKKVRTGLRNLNEIDCPVDDPGSVYANVWHTTDVVQIAKSDGTIAQRWHIDVTKLLSPREQRAVDEFNGIVSIHPREDNRFLLTGKLYPKMWLVRLDGKAQVMSSLFDKQQLPVSLPEAGAEGVPGAWEAAQTVTAPLEPTGDDTAEAPAALISRETALVLGLILLLAAAFPLSCLCRRRRHAPIDGERPARTIGRMEADGAEMQPGE